MAKRGRKRGRTPEKMTKLKSELKAVKKAHEQSINHSRKIQKINIELRNAIGQLKELIDLLAFTAKGSDANIRKTAARLVHISLPVILNNLPKDNNNQKSE